MPEIYDALCDTLVIRRILSGLRWTLEDILTFQNDHGREINSQGACNGTTAKTGSSHS